MTPLRILLFSAAILVQPFAARAEQLDLFSGTGPLPLDIGSYSFSFILPASPTNLSYDPYSPDDAFIINDVTVDVEGTISNGPMEFFDDWLEGGF